MINLFYRLYKIKLITALTIIAPVIAIILSYSYFAYIDFLNLQRAINIGPRPVETELTTDRFKKMLRNRVKQEISRFNISDRVENSPLETYKIYAKPKDIAELNANLPASGKTFIPGYLVTSTDTSIKKIKLHYRGTIPTHWMYKQKSLRIKLDKGNLNHMERTFNLINPPHDYFLIDFINYDISREAGLLAPESKPVNVIINNEYMGVYSYTSQIDESTLRKNKRMPGSIYYGEGGNPRNDGVNSLWYEQISWEKKASRNAESKNNREDIKTFIKGVNSDSPIDFYHFFNQYADKKKFYTFFGIDTLVGGYHHDYAHNHKLYFDPYLGKFEPIQWDIRFWIEGKVKDAATYPLLFNVALNPILEMERDIEAYKLLQLYDSKNMEQRFLHYIKLIYDDLETDPYKDNNVSDTLFSSFYSSPMNMEQFIESSWKQFSIFIEHTNYLNFLYQQVDIQEQRQRLSPDTIKISYRVNGNSPVTIDFNQSSLKNTLQIFRDINNNDQPEVHELAKENQFILYPGRKIHKGNRLGLNVVSMFGTKHLMPSPLYYTFLIKSSSEFVPLVKATNVITGASIEIQKKEFQPDDKSDSIHPWSLPAKATHNTIYLDGDIEVTDDLIFSKNTLVHIAPGTTFTLEADASIFFYGQVQANGSKDKYIRFIAKEQDKPWGSIVIQGESTSGSQLSYIDIKHGSITSRNLIHYPGQLNIHDSEDFKISECTIGSNFKGDDSVHIAYSSGHINNCLFYNARSDALDIDISKVTVSNNLFINSGNDALDLMTSTMTVKENLFIGAGDKCISTGEWSNGTFVDNLFYHCNIGIEVKDQSYVYADQLIFIDNQKYDINLYNKNFRYEQGGELVADHLFMSSERMNKDKRSTVTINKPIQKYPRTLVPAYIQDAIKNTRNWQKLPEQLSIFYQKNTDSLSIKKAD